jgi:23S rRNA (pseudouridine1915-N3)-methyltransferase
MKWVLLTAATAKEKWSEQAQSQFVDKISHFINFEVKNVTTSGKNQRSQQQNKIKSDSDAILEQIKNDDFVVLFDEIGEKLSSEQFSQKMNLFLNSGKKRVVFVIGGSFGVNDDLKKKANLKISLSSFVLNHLVAEVVVLEQIYRGFTILKNLPYHNK